MRFVMCITCFAGLAFPGKAVSDVNDADARLALQIASGLATSAPADMARADVASSPAEGTGRRVTIVDAVLLLRGARGQAPAGVSGSALLKLMDEVRLHGVTERNYTLARAYRITGRLVDSSGNPLSGAVSLGDASDSQKGYGVAGASGEFSMSAGPETLQPSVYVEFPSLDGKGHINMNMRLPRSEAVSLKTDARRDFVRPDRPQTGFITGSISVGGLRASDVTADVQMGEQSGGRGVGWIENGRYHVECPVGAARLMFSAYGGKHDIARVVCSLDEPVQVSSGQTVTRDLKLPALVDLCGTIQGGADWPIRLVEINSWKSREGWMSSSVDSPARNGFWLPVEPGRYTVDVIFVKQEGTTYRQCNRVLTVTVPQGGGRAVLTVPEMPPERPLSGRVLDPSGNPVPGARMTIAPVHSTSEGCDSAHTETAADGSYQMTAPEGAYRVFVEPPR